MRDNFIGVLTDLAAKNPRIVLITGDLGFGVFDKFRQALPRQFINAGVAEQNMTAVATGMALEGYTVFTYSIGNFPTLRCLEQIRNDACYHGAELKVVAIGGGFSYGALGISHHATEDLAIMRSLPDITVFSPCDLWEAEQATRACVETKGTCYLRLDKSFGEPCIRDGEVFVPGRIRMVREGNDIGIVVSGGVMEEVQQAAGELSKQGISVRILSVHTIKPLDAAALQKAASECKAIMTVEEHTTIGGLGGAVAEVLVESGIPVKFKRLGLPGVFSSVVGSQRYLRARFGLDASSIARSAMELLASKR